MWRHATNRRRFILFVGVMFAAGIVMSRLWPHSVPLSLLSIVRPLAWNATDPYDDMPRYAWLSDTDILSFRHHSPNSPNTEPTTYASHWNMPTNVETEMPVLTRAIQAGHGDGPFLDSVSPDGRRVLWINPVSGTHNFYTAFVDGHGLVNVRAVMSRANAPSFEEPTWWMGDGHTLLQTGYPGIHSPLPRQPFAWLLNLDGPERARRIPVISDSEFDNGQFLSAAPDNRLLSMPDEWSGKAGSFLREAHIEERRVDTEVRRVCQWKVHLPPHVWHCKAYFSPCADRVAWLFATRQQFPLDVLMHRWFPRHAAPEQRQQELWISRADGSDMRRVGDIITNSPDPKRLPADDVEIEQMQWLPNGKQISFLYDHSLYLLDVPPSA